MLEQHGKAFTFTSREIGCIDPKIVEPMVIFTIDHVSWNLKPIPVPRAHILKVIDLLKHRLAHRLPYSPLWESASKVRRCAPNALRRKISIRTRRNIGSWTSMWALWPKTVTNKDQCDSSYEKKYVSHNPKFEGFLERVHSITYGFRTMHTLRTHSITCCGRGRSLNANRTTLKLWRSLRKHYGGKRNLRI